jgi:hypothetical protein
VSYLPGGGACPNKFTVPKAMKIKIIVILVVLFLNFMIISLMVTTLNVCERLRDVTTMPESASKAELG